MAAAEVAEQKRAEVAAVAAAAVAVQHERRAAVDALEMSAGLAGMKAPRK